MHENMLVVHINQIVIVKRVVLMDVGCIDGCGPMMASREL